MTSWDWLEKWGRSGAEGWELAEGVRTRRTRGQVWERVESIWFHSL